MHSLKKENQNTLKKNKKPCNKTRLLLKNIKDRAKIEITSSFLNPTCSKIAILIKKRIKNKKRFYFFTKKNYKFYPFFIKKNTHYKIQIIFANFFIFLGKKYFYQAKKILFSSLAFANNKKMVIQTYTKLAIILEKIFFYSKEPIDALEAINIYKNMNYQKDPTILYKISLLYFEMAKLTNNINSCLQATKWLQKAIGIQKNNTFFIFSNLALFFSYLYRNTLNKKYFEKASLFFQKTYKKKPKDKILIEWIEFILTAAINEKSTLKLKFCLKKSKKIKNSIKRDLLQIKIFSFLAVFQNNAGFLQTANKKIIKLLEEKKKNTYQFLYSFSIYQYAKGIYFSDISILKSAKKALFYEKSFKNLHLLGLIYLKIGEEKECIKHLKKAYKYFCLAKDIHNFAPPSLLFDMAKVLIKTGEIRENPKILQIAISYITSLLSFSSEKNHPNWFFYLAYSIDLLADLKDGDTDLYEKALFFYKQALIIDPDFDKIHYHIAICFSHILENKFENYFYEKAIYHFQKASKIDTEDENIYLEWALVIIIKAENSINPSFFYKMAEKKLIQAKLLGSEKSYYFLGCLYSILKKFKEAILMLEIANEKGILPSKEEILEDEWLDNIRHTKDFFRFLQKIKEV